MLSPITVNMSVSLGPHAVLCVVGQSASSCSKWLLKDLEADGVLRLHGCLAVYHVVVYLSAAQRRYRLDISMSDMLWLAKFQRGFLTQDS